MSISVTFRMPTPMLERLQKIEKSTDKTRSAVILELIQSALDLEDYKKQNTDKDKALEELKTECSTVQILHAIKLLGDIYRITFDSKKSKYGDTAKTVDAAIKLMKDDAKALVAGRLKQE